MVASRSVIYCLYIWVSRLCGLSREGGVRRFSGWMERMVLQSVQNVPDRESVDGGRRSWGGKGAERVDWRDGVWWRQVVVVWVRMEVGL